MEAVMSKKKRKQAELEAQKQEVRRSARPRVTFKVMNNCGVVPVAKPADFIQLTPVVQPLSLVPYSTQEQPLAEFDEDDGYYDDDY
jgi:hypothetical protein